MDVRIIFLTAQPPLPLAPFVSCWKRNWDRYSQPHAAHEWDTKGCLHHWSRRRMSVCVCPSKSDRHIQTHFFWEASVCSRFHTLSSLYFFLLKAERDRYSQPLAAHGWATKGCLHRRSRRRMSVCVCPNKSDRPIRAYFFVGLRLVHAFKRFSKLEYVFFSHAVPHFWDVPFNLPLVTLTSILRLPDGASGGHSRSAAKVTPGFAGKARSSLLFCEKNLQPYG